MAGTASCSCPTCRVVCTGKFPGCADVWGRGPQVVVRHRSAPELAARSHRSTPGNGATFDGSNNSTPSQAPPAVLFTRPDTPLASPGAASVARALLAEMRALGEHFENANATWVSPESYRGLEDAAAQLLKEFERIPSAIAAAMGTALENQHERIMIDIRAALSKALSETTAASAANGETHPWAKYRARHNDRS